MNINPPPSSEKHRILLLNFYSVLNTKGGAEHVMSKMANAFVERGHAVKIVFLQNAVGEPAYPLDARVELENCAKNPVPWRWRKKVLRIRSWFIRDKNRRKAFRSHRMDQARACQISPAILKFRPDIIIAFQPESACCITQYFMDHPPIITMMHASPAAFLKHPQTAFLAESDLTVVLLPEYVEQVRQLYGVTHAISIPNAIEEQPPSLYESIKKEKIIICVARISRSEKRQHLLIEAFAELQSKFPDWKVEFWGDTSIDADYISELKRLIHRLGLERQIRICGQTNTVSAVIARASIFALPSPKEGFPLVLCESLAVGVPVVCFRSCTGANHLVRDHENGLLAEDSVDSFALSLEKLMQDEALRQQLGRQGIEDMKAYAPEKIWNQWESVLDSVIGQHESHQP